MSDAGAGYYAEHSWPAMKARIITTRSSTELCSRAACLFEALSNIARFGLENPRRMVCPPRASAQISELDTHGENAGRSSQLSSREVRHCRHGLTPSPTPHPG